ncbi:hypothetical protein CFter6_2536 [Collimonas fungivorans]|uniref:DUF4148 domain-containing protein n=1 Tax=Collimonas fungivorans TaxID=158899 RepID=A0A127PBQ6_9BURK|nr:DUF4148 domain-containing protein [Collimonas fungivorans]AMO95208.1 hypothetical protein CFter6_2536 [Collimonas fungivorans]
MRTIQTIVAILALTATASVFAEAPYPAEQPFVSTQTRAQVEHEVTVAAAQGMLLESDSSYPAVSVPAMPEHKRVMAQLRAQLRDSATHDAGDSIYAGA